MDLTRLAELTRDQLTVGRVFGDPIERDGVTVVPVARVMGGGGGGEGSDPTQQGEGGGWGAYARPAGVYVITGERVQWRPAVDADRLMVVMAAVIVGVVLSRTLARRVGS